LFKDVFKSVDGLRVPMIIAWNLKIQLEISWYSYLESLLNGQEQILSFQQVSPVTSMIFVDAVKHTLAPRTASFPTCTPSTTIQEPIKHRLQ
jgi:hypothetical protein